MKKVKSMKKIGMIALAVIVVLVGFSAMKYRSGGMGMFMGSQLSGGDLVIINDSKDVFSTAFMKDGKTMSQVVHPGQRGTGGKGLIRIFVAQKNGNYEIQYPYPRPSAKPAEISLTQILKAAHGNSEVGDEMIIKKGRIDDIRVDYEEVRNLEATY